MKTTVTLIVFFVAVLAYFTQVDFEAMRSESDLYCEMVKVGRWPDYEKRFNTDCVNR